MNLVSIITAFPFLIAVTLLMIGVYIIIFKKNLIKMVMGIIIMQNGVNLFLVSLAYREGHVAPIWTSAPTAEMVLPTSHALTLTSIVIGLATTALMLSYTILIKKHYGSIDIQELWGRKD